MTPLKQFYIQVSMIELTEHQQKFLNEISDYIRKERRSPTTRELQGRLNLKSPRSVVQYLEHLEQAGYIRRGKGARNIQLIENYRRQNESSPPKVFISYSHDSPEHKKWVKDLAEKLRGEGVNAILDQWELKLGEDVTLFMEHGIEDADYVLVICTDTYIRKAEGGFGGVGYERLIVTSEFIEDIGRSKFIPIVKDVSGSKKTPRFLLTRKRIETVDGEIGEEDFQELLKILRETPELPPPLGDNPLSRNLKVKSIHELPDIRVDVGDPVEIYDTAVQLTRQVDVAGWRQLVKKVRGPVNNALLQWRIHIEQTQVGSKDWQERVDGALQCAAPLFAIALAGIESGRSEFSDQRALFDDLYNISGWNHAGLMSVIKTPSALGYFYHSLHGAMCALIGNYDAALKLVDIVVKVGEAGHYAPIHRHHGLMGWTESLNQYVSGAWEFLSGSADRWPWLEKIFGGASQYRTGLCAYYMLLSLNELAGDLAEKDVEEYPTDLSLDIPLCFVTEPPEIVEKAVTMLQSHPELLQAVWEKHGVKTERVLKVWPSWLKASQNWLWKVYQAPGLGLREPRHAALLMPFEGKLKRGDL